ncbi:fluoride efflux transporter CrcB [Kineosporia sp. J2-2]|uniref:Fluoride-specific ion channel FluC n=1 Tax=Kineosporia corallincola TaxID=2835133 RepID=A0ABS5TFG2_9ACTN|nr:fluoride efflux transporter CrcB [Kineosporia corallincola]MBT0769806.1 fluoride efflux transporter CrcB [Kineosporia corallincola]
MSGSSCPRRDLADYGHRVLVVIALGGVVGAEARYGLTRLIPAQPGGVPWAILGINVAGGFFMGLLMAWLGRAAHPHPLVRPFLGVGILGGFTTFSTYSTDTYHLIDADRPSAAVGYVALTLAGALIAVVLGQWLGSARPGSSIAGDSGSAAAPAASPGGPASLGGASPEDAASVDSASVDSASVDSASGDSASGGRS